MTPAADRFNTAVEVVLALVPRKQSTGLHWHHWSLASLSGQYKLSSQTKEIAEASQGYRGLGFRSTVQKESLSKR